MERIRYKNEKGTISLNQIHDFLFFLFMCAASAHQTGEGVDFYIIRGTFIIYFAVAVYYIIKNVYWKINGFIGWYLLFVLYIYLTLWWAPNTNAVGAYLGTFIQAFGIIIGLTNRIKNKEDILKMLRYVVYSIYYLGIVLLFKTSLDELGNQERLGGAVGLHSNEIGFRLAVGALFSLFFLFSLKKQKIIFTSGLIFCSVLTVMTGTRQAFAIILIGFVLYATFGALRASKYKLYKRIVILAAVTCFIGILWYLVFNNEYLYSIIGYRLDEMLSGFFGEGRGDSSMIEREFLRKQAWILFLENPVIGYGLNCFSVFINTTGFGRSTYAHNNYLELLSTTGIIGAVIYYSMFLYLIVGLFKAPKNEADKGLKSIYIIFLFLLLLQSYWSVNFQNEFIYVILMMIFLFIKFSNKEKIEKNS